LKYPKPIDKNVDLNQTSKRLFFYISNMPRYEKRGNPISIAYGHDHVTGFFLTVTDKRLMWQDNADKDVNEVTSRIGSGDGGLL